MFRDFILAQYTVYYQVEPICGLESQYIAETTDDESLSLLKTEMEEAVRSLKARKSPLVDDVPSDLI
ncbi:hypothetical protein DPMN_038991 [Dreissena polymorpha]|uniref:Uncharacterized protein n=1 Tax=Dreissena polymorpha TaxID=45954 RepID=A0A9D4RR82_DREPO|nr:hypothetical protein DPMN_038991 [Dreissena polymorpha]